MNNNFLLHNGEVEEGKIIIATVNSNNYIHKSTDYGASWSPVIAAGARYWDMIAMSETTQYQYAVVWNESKVYRSSDYGTTWTVAYEMEPGAHGISVATDRSGQYVLIGTDGDLVRKSSDFGVNWTIVSNGIYANCNAVAISLDTAQYQFFAFYGGDIYRSSNYGASFTTVRSNDNYESIFCSESGQYVTAIIDSETIYVSADYGDSWTAKYIAEGKTKQGDCSKTGQYQTVIAIKYNSPNTVNIYRSADYGTTWTKTILVEAIASYLSSGSVRVAPSGKTQLVAVEGDYIYKSKDYGLTWTKLLSSGSKQWTSIATSKI